VAAANPVRVPAAVLRPVRVLVAATMLSRVKTLLLLLELELLELD
jgi:hypothetical protein